MVLSTNQQPPVEDNSFCLVDGLQRYTAVSGFLSNEFSVYVPELDDFIWAGNLGRMANRVTLKIHVNNLRSRADVLDWYLSLNAGTPHTDEELNRVRKMRAECE